MTQDPDPTADSLLSSMNGESITNSWDAVCAISAGRANELFALKFTDMIKLGLKEAGLVISQSVNAGNGLAVIFEGVTLSPPLIRIDPTIASGQVSLSFLLLAGTIVVIQADGDEPLNGSFSSLVSISPASDFQITATVPLAATSLDVSEGAQIVFQVKDSGFNLNNDVTWDDVTKAAIGQVLSNALSAGVALNFPIATLPPSAEGALSPVSAAVSTQVELQGTDEGRLLVFIATSWNPGGGSQTTLNTANVVPSGYDTALIISSNALVQMFGSSIIDSFGKNSGLDFRAQAQEGSNLTGLQSTAGTYSFQSQESCYIGTAGDFILNSICWTDFAMPCTDAFAVVFNPNNTPCGNYEFVTNANWQQAITYASNNGPGCSMSNAGPTDEMMATMILGPSALAISASMGRDGSTVSFELSGNIAGSFSNGDSNFENNVINGFEPASQSDQMGSNLSQSVGSLIAKGLQPIHLFVLENFLFSADRLFMLESAYTPGDLVCFGSVQMPDWYLASTPSQDGPIAICQAGQSLSIESNGSGIPASVTWLKNPSSPGKLIANGSSATYEAPGNLPYAVFVIVTALDTANPDNTVQLPIVVTPATLSVNPAAAVLMKREQLTLAASSADPNGANLQWDVDQPMLILNSDAGSTVSATVSEELNAVSLAKVTVSDPASSVSGAGFLLLVPFLDGSANLYPSLQAAVPGSTVNITADGSVKSWQVFCEGTMATVTATVTPAGLSVASVAIDVDASEGSFLFVVAFAANPQMPSAVAVITVMAATGSDAPTSIDRQTARK